MKKLVLIMAVITSVLFISGCKKGETAIKLPNTQITVNLNQEFDLLEGVKAVNEKNKNITEDIIVKSGDFSTAFLGTYDVTYEVTDKNGNVVSKTRTIEVVDPIALMASPEVSNGNQLVIDYEGLQVTKAELYTQLRDHFGLQSILEMVHSDILADYQEELNFSRDIVLDTIDKIKANYTDEEWIKVLASIGIIMEVDESLEDVQDKIYDYFKIPQLERVAAEARANAEITSEEITEAKKAYVEDVCIINLSYETTDGFNTALDKFDALEGDALLQAFDAAYVAPEEKKGSDESYLASQLTCDYDRYVYNETPNSNFKTTIFDELTVGEYTTDSTITNGNYQITYKVAVANDKSTYDDAKFTTAIKSILVNKKITDDYKFETLTKLRTDAGLTIYDPRIHDGYKRFNNNLVLPDMNGKVVASYGNQEITADELYDYMKNRYASVLLADEIKKQTLLSIDGVKLTEADQTYIDSIVSQLKQQYLQSQYKSILSFDDFLQYNFQFDGLAAVKTYLEISKLYEIYLLGNENYAGENPVTDQEIDEAYENFFNVKASHILFKFNTEEERVIAETKANQLIRGVQEDEKPYIQYKDAEGIYTDFIGLDKLSQDELTTQFAALAKEYSDDTSSGANGGDLGFFNPGRMVKTFEDEVRALMANGELAYSDAPVKTEYGYHVLLITEIGSVADVPDKDYTEEEVAALRKTDPESEILAYYDNIAIVENNLKRERLSVNPMDDALATLQTARTFQFLDAEIQKYYEIYKN